MGIERKSLRAGIGFALAAACALACSSPQGTPKAPAPIVSVGGVARYLPLEDATVFSYETSTEQNRERGLLVLEVRRPRPETAELVVAGRARRLTVSREGVAHVTGGFLLREPFSLGASFRGDFGQVRITRMNHAVAVPAGKFTDCVETTEEMTIDAGTKRTVTVYCAGIGITLRETTAEQDDQLASERIALKSWGKRFDPSTAAR
jgi:hypothetical protein